MTGPGPGGDLFAVLGLPAVRELTDDDVRSAWRRVAAATHPDRADGGDPDRFARAAAAYTTLRTASGRGEARADAAAARARGRTGRGRPVMPLVFRHPAGRAARFALRVRDGRPRRLALRILAAAAVSAGAVAAVGFAPAAPALMTGALTWLIRTGRGDLAPPRGGRR
ncbi:MAG: J domain-containing protein [Streptosporangiaceae bacterium]